MSDSLMDRLPKKGAAYRREEGEPEHGEWNFECAGIVSSDGRPVVLLKITDKDGKSTELAMSPNKMLDIAFGMMEASEGAITDAFFVRFAKEMLEQEDPQIGQLLHMLQEFRSGIPARKGWYHSYA